MSADPRSPSAAKERAVTVTPATPEWGCAFDRCLERAHVVVTGSDGAGWGACTAHVRAMKQIAKEADRA